MNGKLLGKIFDEYCKERGYKVYNTESHRATPRGMKGFPDRFVIGDDFVAFAEIKGEGDKLREEQALFMRLMAQMIGNTEFKRVVRCKLIDSEESIKELLGE